MKFYYTLLPLPIQDSCDHGNKQDIPSFLYPINELQGIVLPWKHKELFHLWCPQRKTEDDDR